MVKHENSDLKLNEIWVGHIGLLKFEQNLSRSHQVIEIRTEFK